MATAQPSQRFAAPCIQAAPDARLGPGDDDDDEDETPIGDPDDDGFDDDEDEEDDEDDTLWARSSPPRASAPALRPGTFR